MEIVNLLESFRFVYVGEDLTLVVQNMLDVNFSEVVSFSITELAQNI